MLHMTEGEILLKYALYHVHFNIHSLETIRSASFVCTRIRVSRSDAKDSTFSSILETGPNWTVSRTKFAAFQLKEQQTIL